MQQSKAILLFVLLQTITLIVVAQKDTEAIHLQLQNNQANFSSTLRPLHQTAGAPEAFYSYFWELGDGNFSFRENPTHVYADTGTYNVRLYATNNYDDGKPPPLKPKPVRVKTSSYAANDNSFFKQGGAIEMKVNRMPRADEDMILIMGYRNENKNISLNGSVVLFYNEKQFGNNNFDLTEERTYNNEKRTTLNSITALSPGFTIQKTSMWNVAGVDVPMSNEAEGNVDRKFSDLITSKQKIFRANTTWHFTNLEQGKEKYFFLSLHTTPAMIKDTNAVVTLTGMFVPDDPNAEIEEFNLELQIVASHDPNRMMLKNSRLNYRFTGTKKEMQYTVRFQNTGKGPSRQIKVGVGISSMMDAGSLEILDHYPKCILCKLAREGQSCLDTIIRSDSIYFVFKNIYLPGLREEGMTDPDSTVGFVKYRVHFNNQLKKLPFESGAIILFDKNKPLSTNGAKGYFKPGNSPAVIVGYNKFLGTGNRNNADENYWMAGGAISSYSPYKKYLQAELLLGIRNTPEQFINRLQNKDTSIDNAQWLIIYRDTYEKQKVIKLQLVPLELRYNFIDFIGGGLGTQLSFDAITQSSFRKEMQLVKQPNGTPMMVTSTQKQTKWFSNFDVALFADVQVGLVRVGPVAGIRYLHYFRFPQNALFLYAAWRL